MANTIGNYNPIFFAQEALILLEKALGLAGRVHRGFEREREAYGLGDTVRIRKPGTFTAQDAPSTAQNLDTGSVTLTLNNFKEVKFEVKDTELTYTGERIINDHIRPAVYALADKIDQDLASLYKYVPWQVDLQTTPAVRDITDMRQNMFDRAVPLGDTSMLHLMINGFRENGFLQLSAFTQQQGAGDQGTMAQMRGSLGMKFGFNVFANQNTPSHTTGSASTTTLAVNGAFLKGVTSINLDAVSVTGTLAAGDIFSIAGDGQKYTCTALNTASGNAFTAVAISPPLSKDTADNAVVTVTQGGGASTASPTNLAFHRNWAALAMVPLSMLGDGKGADMSVANSPDLTLSVRASMWYDGGNKKLLVSLDCLYGFVCLDPNLAVRGRGAGG